MSSKAVAWSVLAAVALALIFLLNHWASFQPLSTLVYSGIALALCGLANLALPFRFLGIRKRSVGAFLLAGGSCLAIAALLWPAPMIRVAQHRTVLDDIIPEYQFSERHSKRVHAKPDQAMQAIRQATWGDMKSLITLLRIRGAVIRKPYHDTGDFAQDKRILDAFSASGYLFGGGEHEVAMFGVWNAKLNRHPDVHNLQQLADYREQGMVKTGYDFIVEDAGGGWSTITTETRMAVPADFTPARRSTGD